PPRQHDVQEDEVERSLQSPRQPLLSISRRVHLEAFAEQPVGEREHEAGLVLHQQDAPRGRRSRVGKPLRDHAGSSTACTCSTAWAGRERVKALPPLPPLPAAPDPPVVTVTRPPWASAMWFTRLRPRPLPGIPPAAASRPRKKGLKR